jgi:uncharacterized protein YxeA
MQKNIKVEMTKRQYVVVLAGPVAVIALILSIFNAGLLDFSDNRVENIKIEVSYSGSWEGTLYNNEKLERVSGFTRKTIFVYRPDGDEWTVSFEAEKKDYSSNQLKVTLRLIDGTILDESQTIDPYGKVAISFTIE